MNRNTARITVAPFTAGSAGLWLQVRARRNGPALWQRFWAFGRPITPLKRSAAAFCAAQGFSLMLDLNGKPFVDTNDHQQANDRSA